MKKINSGLEEIENIELSKMNIKPEKREYKQINNQNDDIMTYTLIKNMETMLNKSLENMKELFNTSLEYVNKNIDSMKKDVDGLNQNQKDINLEIQKSFEMFITANGERKEAEARLEFELKELKEDVSHLATLHCTPEEKALYKEMANIKKDNKERFKGYVKKYKEAIILSGVGIISLLSSSILKFIGDLFTSFFHIGGIK